MTSKRKRGFTDIEKAEIWKFWRCGESLSSIGRLMNKDPGSVFGILRLQGGITPAIRRRSKHHLSLQEREEISRGLAAGFSIRKIANQLRRSASTICREVNRHGGAANYRATDADVRAWELAKRPKLCLLAQNKNLRKAVAKKLSIEWSPEQIAGWLKTQYPDNGRMHISHESIYRTLFIQSRGVLKKELLQHLRSRRLFRHSRLQNVKGLTRGSIRDLVAISERPPEVEDRSVPGHWEGDLIAGSNNTHIATLVERQSRYTILVKIDGKDTGTVVKALVKKIKKLPGELKGSLTWDRGSELADHKAFTVATNVKVYFCDPSSPWQRGTNENTNRLLRQYLPKKTDLSQHSQNDLNVIARRLNQRPRKTLAFATPADKLAEALH